MATFNFLPLPLELRNIIYDHVLRDSPDILTNGLPSLYKIHSSITKELYTYRKTLLTVKTTRSSRYPCNFTSENPPQTQIKILALIERFEEEKKEAKGIVVVFRAIPLPIQRIEEDRQGVDEIYTIVMRLNAALKSVEDTFTESKAMFWSVEFRFMGVETRVDRSRIRECWNRLLSR
jgi:hypothetical protein